MRKHLLASFAAPAFSLLALSACVQIVEPCMAVGGGPCGAATHDGGGGGGDGSGDGGGGGNIGSDGGVAMSSAPRVSAASVPAADVQTQSQDNTDFAFALYAQLKTQPDNLFFSPYSISSALAMTYAGAATTTQSAMASALHFSLPPDRAFAAFDAIDSALAGRAAQGTSSDGGAFKLNVANALWAQQGFHLQQAYLDTLAMYYGAGVRLEDFVTAPDPSRLQINQWVSDNTAGKIPNLLAPGTVSSDTRLVLTNAVYFNGSWSSAFLVAATQPAPFTRLDGTTESVPVMHQSLATRYATGTGWQAAELPYSNPALTLTLIVPDAGSFSTVESQLSGAFLTQVIAAEQETQLELGLPRFAAATQASLVAPLTALGMGAAFSSDADFSGIDGAHDLSISGVIHQANITVDEAGTEAAAATAVVVGINSVLSNRATLTIDRPFILVLRDQPTGAVLFVGRIAKP